MELADEWVTETRHWARAAAEHAHGLVRATEADLPALQAAAGGLIATLTDALPLLPACERVEAVLAWAPLIERIDAARAEDLVPLRQLGGQLSAIAGPGLGPRVWAQERTDLPEVLRRMPLPQRERRVVDNMLWTRDMFGSATRALDGVAEEIDRQDGSGARKAAEAARELERIARQPPPKPDLVDRFVRWLGSLFD